MAWELTYAFATTTTTTTTKILWKYLYWLCLFVQYGMKNIIQISTHPIHQNYYVIMLLFMICIIQFIISFFVDAVFRKSNWEWLEILYSIKEYNYIVWYNFLCFIIWWELRWLVVTYSIHVPVLGNWFHNRSSKHKLNISYILRVQHPDMDLEQILQKHF